VSELGIVHIEEAKYVRILWSSLLEYLDSIEALFGVFRILKIDEGYEHWLS
jgi:hypothetical protein